MISLWSEHTSGPARRAIDYLLGETVTVYVGRQRRQVARDPAPELLRGDPRIVARTIDTLKTRRSYRCATLSFTQDDVDTDKWRRREPETCRKIDGAIDLWMETAFAGIASDARPPVLVGTHLHTGRLELNLLVPSCLTMTTASGQRIPRSYNPHPPTAASRSAWMAYEDTLNGAHGWRDPRDPANVALLRGPSWAEKRAVALGRWVATQTVKSSPGSEADPLSEGDENLRAEEDPRVRLLAAAKSEARKGVADRVALLDRLASVLEELEWEVDECREAAIVLAPKDAMDRRSLTLRGTLCEAEPRPPSSVAIATRTRTVAAAPERLARAWRERANSNAVAFGPAAAGAPMDPLSILRRPSPPVFSPALLLQRIAERLLDRIAAWAGIDAVGRALAWWAGAEGGLTDARRSFARLAAMPPILVAPAPAAMQTVVAPTQDSALEDGPSA